MNKGNFYFVLLSKGGYVSIMTMECHMVKQ